MIFVYYDYGGTHSTSLAAAFHLGFLSHSESKLTKEQVKTVPYFNKLKKKDAGHFIFHGIDEMGHSVYTLGKRSSKLVIPSLLGFSEVLTEKAGLSERIIFSNTSPTVPFAMTIGGFFARGLGLNFIGSPLLVIGAKQAGSSIKELVDKTKALSLLELRNQQIVHLTNEEFQA